MLQFVLLAALLCVAHAGNTVVSAGSAAGRAIISGHNAARRAVGMGSLIYDSGLATNAYNHGRTISCGLVHTSQAKRAMAASISNTRFTVPAYSYKTWALKYYGENLYVSSSSSQTAASAASGANAGWINKERAVYNLASNTCSGVCGHYTQIIWKETKYVGCSHHTCTGTRWGSLMVCQYWPAGNMAGAKPTISHTGYGNAAPGAFSFDFKSNTTMLLLGATLLNTLMIVAMIIYKSRRSSNGYQKQLAQTDYDTEEEAINQVV